MLNGIWAFSLLSYGRFVAKSIFGDRTGKLGKGACWVRAQR